MFHADSSFCIGLRTIGTLLQFLHHLSIGTTIQFPHQNHRNKNEPYNEPQNPVPMTTIQNKQQNLKNQIKPKDPGKSQRRIEVINWAVNSKAFGVSMGKSQRRIEEVLTPWCEGRIYQWCLG